MSDILSSASLLLAIFTSLYGFYYPAINGILKIKLQQNKHDNRASYILALEVQKTKLWPLVIGSSILTVTFLPEAVRIICKSIRVVEKYGVSFKTYDTISASFLVVVIFMVVLLIHIICLAVSFKKQKEKLNPDGA